MVAVAAVGVTFAGSAAASTILGRNAGDARLEVNARGEALVTYRAQGKQQHVLAWNGLNALAPTQQRPQIAFSLDYSGGFQARYRANPAVKRALAKLRSLQSEMSRATVAGDNPRRYAIAPRIAATYRSLERLRRAAASFANACRPYSGPALPWLVVGCTAPDGSFWALQSWQRMLPNLGETPWLPSQTAWELHLSHWTGALPALEVHLDWVNTQKAQHLFGRLTYRDQPVYGFGSRPNGDPTDSYGRNIYLDVLDAPGYGSGWRRENSFLAHNPSGNFCYAFYPHTPYPGYPLGDRPAGTGERYRATVIGPGVLPDIGWEAPAIGEWSLGDPAVAAYEQQMNALSDTLRGDDKLCRQH